MRSITWRPMVLMSHGAKMADGRQLEKCAPGMALRLAGAEGKDVRVVRSPSDAGKADPAEVSVEPVGGEELPVR